MCANKWRVFFFFLIHWAYLPQIYDGKKKPEVLVDGWNVYFFDDLKTLVSLFFFFFDWAHHTVLITCPSCDLPPAAQSLATVSEQHGVSGRAVARPAPLLHRGLWLQRARRLHPSAQPPHHLQQAVDIQIHCHWRSACVTFCKKTVLVHFVSTSLLGC